MKKLIACLLFVASAGCMAADAPLLERALSCKLQDDELASLMKNLAAGQAGFAKPAAAYGAPSVNLFQLPSPAHAWGYASTEVVVMPARILLAVQGDTIEQAVARLGLTETPFSPARKPVRKSVSVVALQLSNQRLSGKLLVGCEYAHPAAAAWME